MRSYIYDEFLDTDQLLLMGVGVEYDDYVSELVVIEPGPKIEERVWRAVETLLAANGMSDPHGVLEWALFSLQDLVDSESLHASPEALDCDAALALLLEHKKLKKDPYVIAAAALNQALTDGETDVHLLALEVGTHFTAPKPSSFFEDMFEQTTLDEIVFCGGLDMQGVGFQGESEGFVIYRKPRSDDKKSGKRYFSRKKIHKPLQNIGKNSQAGVQIARLIAAGDTPNELGELITALKWDLKKPLITDWLREFSECTRMNALRLSIFYDRVESVKYLLEGERGERSRKDGESLVLDSAYMKAQACTKFLFEHDGLDVEEHGDAALEWGARAGMTWLVRWLLEQNVAASNDALDGALEAKDLEAIALLVNAGADLNYVGDFGPILKPWKFDEKQTKRLKDLGAVISKG